MSHYPDQTGHIILLPQVPQRIVSLVPSQTELLADLGLDSNVVGITKFCIHPKRWFTSLTRIGGTKQLNISLIRSLHPDLILANKEENVAEQVNELARDFPVWTSDIPDLTTAFAMMKTIGEMTGTTGTAAALIGTIRKRFDELAPPPVRRRVCYLIWQDPMMTVGGDTFIHSMLQAAGFDNVFAVLARYPVIDLQQIAASECTDLFLASEPFPFSSKHAASFTRQLSALGNSSIRVHLVNGELFSWYGSRMQYAPGYFAALRSETGVT